MDKTPDVAQLSYCCGKPLVWTSTANEGGEVDGWGSRCPGCGMEWQVLPKPARLLLPTEQMLLARIAALEEAQRWRVTAEEMPPVGVPVVALRADDPGWPCDIVVRLDSGAWADSSGFTGHPARWLPLPGAPDAHP